MKNTIIRFFKLCICQKKPIKIHFVCNDKIFTNKFNDTFNLEYEYSIIEHSYNDLFLHELELEIIQDKHVSFVIIDHIYDNSDNIHLTKGIQLAKEILKIDSTSKIILLTPTLDKLEEIQQSIFPVIRNENSAQRVQNVILTLYNEYLIKKSKISNTILIQSLTALFIAIALFIIIYAISVL